MILLDAIDEMGSRSSLSRDADGSDQWDMNYHEAAIFLEVTFFIIDNFFIKL